jgi:hypothetical protein
MFMFDVVGERVTNKEVGIWDQGPVKDRRVTFEPKCELPAKVRFAVDIEAHAGPTAGQTKQDRCAPIKIVGGCAWSPGIYQALRLLGRSLDVAWEKAFNPPLT